MTDLSNKETVLLLEVFEESLRDGLDIKYILKRLENTFAKRNKADVIRHMKSAIFEGGSISRGFEGIIPLNLVEAIEAGERTGNLDVIFEELRKVYELKVSIQSKLRKASAYPLSVLGVMVALLIVALFFLIPRFALAFKSFDQSKIPAATKQVFAISKYLNDHVSAVILGAAVVLGTIIYLVVKHSYLLYKVPIVQKLLVLQENATAFRLLSVFYEAGINQVRAMEAIEHSLSGPLKQVLRKAREALKVGDPISQAFAKGGAKEDFVVYLEVGESTGKIEKYFRKLSTIEADKLEHSVDKLTSIINLSLMIFAGLAVIGFFQLTISPIYSAISKF